MGHRTHAVSRVFSVSLVLIVGLAGLLFHLLYGGLALKDPQMGLALSASSESSVLSGWRVRLQLWGGADPNLQDWPWGGDKTPLMAAVDADNRMAASVLASASSEATWKSAVVYACEQHDHIMHEVLSHGAHGEAARICRPAGRQDGTQNKRKGESMNGSLKDWEVPQTKDGALADRPRQ